ARRRRDQSRGGRRSRCPGARGRRLRGAPTRPDAAGPRHRRAGRGDRRRRTVRPRRLHADPRGRRRRHDQRGRERAPPRRDRHSPRHRAGRAGHGPRPHARRTDRRRRLGRPRSRARDAADRRGTGDPGRREQPLVRQRRGRRHRRRGGGPDGHLPAPWQPSPVPGRGGGDRSPSPSRRAAGGHRRDAGVVRGRLDGGGGQRALLRRWHADRPRRRPRRRPVRGRGDRRHVAWRAAPQPAAGLPGNARGTPQVLAERRDLGAGLTHRRVHRRGQGAAGRRGGGCRAGPLRHPPRGAHGGPM
ncbi:MAG: Diacylglycerol kinase-related protein, partial [uncultured Thermomicrobiales bacterium]